MHSIKASIDNEDKGIERLRIEYNIELNEKKGGIMIVIKILLGIILTYFLVISICLILQEKGSLWVIWKAKRVVIIGLIYPLLYLIGCFPKNEILKKIAGKLVLKWYNGVVLIIHHIIGKIPVGGKIEDGLLNLPFEVLETTDRYMDNAMYYIDRSYDEEVKKRFFDKLISRGYSYEKIHKGIRR